MSKAWTGDWRARMDQALRARGRDSLTAFAESRPQATLLELAESLDCSVAAIQLEAILREEAVRGDRFDDFVRSSLVRCVRARIPEGWGAGARPDFQVASAYGSWRATVGDQNAAAAREAWKALKAAPPPRGWLPEGPDDPLLVEALRGVVFRPPS